MVECALGAAQGDAEWDAWYAHMKPPALLLSVPGFRAAQRFRGLTRTPPAYLAVYGVDSPAVMTSPAYRSAGGGNFLTDQWKPLITYWHRMLFDGAEMAPAVGEDDALVVFDSAAPEDIPGLAFLWLRSVGLDQPTPWRGLFVLERAAALAAVDRSGGCLAAFAPRMPRLTPA